MISKESQWEQALCFSSLLFSWCLEQGLPHSRSFVNNEWTDPMRRPIKHFQKTHQHQIPSSHLTDQNLKLNERNNLIKVTQRSVSGQVTLTLTQSLGIPFSQLSSPWLCPNDRGSNGCQFLPMRWQSCYVTKPVSQQLILINWGQRWQLAGCSPTEGWGEKHDEGLHVPASHLVTRGVSTGKISRRDAVIE